MRRPFQRASRDREGHVISTALDIPPKFEADFQQHEAVRISQALVVTQKPQFTEHTSKVNGWPEHSNRFSLTILTWESYCPVQCMLMRANILELTVHATGHDHPHAIGTWNLLHGMLVSSPLGIIQSVQQISLTLVMIVSDQYSHNVANIEVEPYLSLRSLHRLWSMLIPSSVTIHAESFLACMHTAFEILDTEGR